MWFLEENLKKVQKIQILKCLRVPSRLYEIWEFVGSVF